MRASNWILPYLMLLNSAHSAAAVRQQSSERVRTVTALNVHRVIQEEQEQGQQQNNADPNLDDTKFDNNPGIPVEEQGKNPPQEEEQAPSTPTSGEENGNASGSGNANPNPNANGAASGKKDADNKYHDETKDSAIPRPVLVLALLFGFYMIRKRAMENSSAYNGRWIVGANDPDDYDGNYSMRHRGQEMVPLSNEDEWGWEDNARRDLELGLAEKEEEDLQTALALSLSTKKEQKAEDPTSTIRKKGTKQQPIQRTAAKSVRSPSPLVVAAKKSVSPIVEETSSWDDDSDWDDEEPLSTATPAAASTTRKTPASVPTIEELLNEQQSRSGQPVITSLSKSTTKSKLPSALKKEPVKKKGEDDIFASMGLSSVPKKNNPKPRSKMASAAIAKTAPSISAATPSGESSWKNRSSLGAESIEVGSTGSDWGDDEDLDDLLTE